MYLSQISFAVPLRVEGVNLRVRPRVTHPLYVADEDSASAVLVREVRKRLRRVAQLSDQVPVVDRLSNKT
jgi:hypothetical protein